MKPEDYKQFLRSHKFDPENRPKERGDAIHAAIIEKRVYIAIELLNLYPKDCLEARSRSGSKNWRTPLHNACENERTLVVKNLLDKGADVNARSFRKLTPLIFATEARNLEIVKLLVEKGADANLQTDQKTTERSALHVAATIESPDFVLTLLVNGADPKLVNTTGNTPLHLAVRSGCASAAALLLFHGASPTVKNENGKSPLDLVEKLNQGDREQFIHIFECAKKEGEFGDFLDRHIRSGIPVDLVAAIHWAISQDLERAVAYILHIDPHATGATLPRGWYPLHVAARAGHEKCVEVLLEHGAEVDCKTKTGYTPLMLAAEKGHKKTFRSLLEYGASRSATNESGDNAWKIARQHGHRFPMLLPVRHVDPSEVNCDDKELDDNNSLAPPKERPQCRTPSPGPRDVAEDPGELYAIGDARSQDEQSTPTPQKFVYNISFSGIANKHSSENFEAFLKTLEETWYNRIGWHPDDDIEGPTDKWPGPVKIAILDTGIDLTHPDFSQPAKRRTKIGAKLQTSAYPEEIQSKRIKACKNFADGPDDDVTDEDGHGTHIAGLIMTIAPRAELYIAKVSSSRKPDDNEEGPKKKPTRGGKQAHPIREALRWAIENRVNIINMSLGFSEQGSLELVQTLAEADSKGICVFAAAANHGDIHAVAWPARDYRLANCVGSTDEHYKLAWFSPTANENFPIFGTFGVDISSHWPGGGYRRMSGTSVSTPIAVGMAAMIIAFLNKKNDLDIEDKERNLDRPKEWRIRGTMGMGRVLARMCRESNGLRLLSPRLMWEKDSRRKAHPITILGFLSEWEGYELN